MSTAEIEQRARERAEHHAREGLDFTAQTFIACADALQSQRERLDAPVQEIEAVVSWGPHRYDPLGGGWVTADFASDIARRLADQKSIISGLSDLLRKEGVEAAFQQGRAEAAEARASSMQERCAKECEVVAEKYNIHDYSEYVDPKGARRVHIDTYVGANLCAAAIRALPKEAK